MNNTPNYPFVEPHFAYLAASLGFDDVCFGYYTHPNTKSVSLRLKTTNSKLKDTEVRTVKMSMKKVEDKVAAPTYQQLLDWIREKYKLVAYVDFWHVPKVGLRYFGCISSTDDPTLDHDCKDFEAYNDALLDLVNTLFDEYLKPVNND